MSILVWLESIFNDFVIICNLYQISLKIISKYLQLQLLYYYFFFNSGFSFKFFLNVKNIFNK